MRILVTGGAGYVGSALVPALLDAGARLRVVDNLMFGRQGLESVLDRIDLVDLDIRCIEPRHLRNIDVILHLAAVSNDPTSEFDRTATVSINTAGTLRLARIAKESGVRRFIFASSCSVYYTDTPDDEIRNELSPVEPFATYSLSKRQAEVGLLEMADSKFCPIILRKGTVFGQSPRMRYDLVVNTFTKDAYAKQCLTVHSDGQMWRPLLDISDAIGTYLALLEANEACVHGQVFNVLSDNYRIADVAREIQRVLASAYGIRLQVNTQDATAARSYRVDGTKFFDALGPVLKGSLEPTVREMWGAIEPDMDLEDPIFYNMKWFERLAGIEQMLKNTRTKPA